MNSSKADNLVYRSGVGMMMVNDDGLIFVADRSDMSESAWQMPQGGIDDGETPSAAALRELAEEVGTDKLELIAETRNWLAYDFPADIKKQVWKGRYRGQRQKWFLFRFTGTTPTSISMPTTENSIAGSGLSQKQFWNLSCPSNVGFMKMCSTHFLFRSRDFATDKIRRPDLFSFRYTQ